jgi:hypothetical protein
MSVLAAGKVWTFWMGVGVFVLVAVATIGVIVGYLMKVVRPKYPPRSASRS